MNLSGSDQYQHFITLLNRYPSPHNGQPMVLEPQPDGLHTVYFDTTRGLTATPISNLFSFVTIGVFFRYVELCALAAGMNVSPDVKLPNVDEMGTGKELLCGSFQLTVGENSDAETSAALEFRQTSRKKYSEGLNDEERAALASVGSNEHIRLKFLTHADSMKAVWLNQRAVFDDMFDSSVRAELTHWMRFDAKEKADKKDGLSYDCMELNSASLKFVFKHYKVLHWPVIKDVLRRYYIRTMKDASTVGYMSAPFETEQQAYEIGRHVMDVWIELSKRGKYLHPFGTIVSNDQAHKDFAELVGMTNENRAENYIVFIFRAGLSDKPVESERIGIKDHLLKGTTE